MTMSLTTTGIGSFHEWPSSSYHHRSRSRLRCIPCGRCHAVIQHDSRAPWSVVNKLVNMHWDACPGKPHVSLGQIPPPLSEAPPPLSSLAPSSPIPIPTPAGESGSTNRSLSKKGGGGGREFAGPTRTSSSITSAGWERKRKTEEQRKKELDEDEYAENVTATSVTCVGCRKQISLDKRSRYYPGLWVKHKNKCPDVDRLKRAVKCNENEQLLEDNQSVARPPSTIASTPSVHSAAHEIMSFSGHDTDSRGGGESELHIERRDQESLEWGNGTAAVAQGSFFYVGQDTDSSFEDEEEEDEEDDGTDSPMHVPFPALNGKFYQQCNLSEEWTYRYATQEEVLTNVYRSHSR